MDKWILNFIYPAPFPNTPQKGAGFISVLFKIYLLPASPLDFASRLRSRRAL